MHRISRAPVLSATFRRVSFWITCTLQDLDQAPALGAAHRARLDHPHEVALVGVVALVVSVQRRRGAHDLLGAAGGAMFFGGRGGRGATSIFTVMVLSALSETTLPRRTLGAPVPCSAGG